MNTLFATLSGLVLGCLLGAFGGALIGSQFDNPSASHVTQGASVFAGTGLGGLLGATIGAVLGWQVGRRADRRELQQAGTEPRMEKSLRSSRVTWWTVAICIVLCVLPDVLFAVVNQYQPALIAMFLLGLFASLPVMGITTRQTRRPRLLGTITGFAVGAVVVGNRIGFLAGLAGGTVCGLLGCTFAHMWAARRPP
jgi:hypothetical protein